MIKYTPQELPEHNVNVAYENPLLELLKLLSGMLGAALAVYLLLGIAVDLVAPIIPTSVEQGLEPISQAFTQKMPSTPKHQQRVKAIINRLTQHYPGIPFELKVHIKQSNNINALALPAGHIIVFTGLLDAVESDNELAFILAHELGHFRNRDHLRSMGRGLIFIAVSTALLGSDNAVSKMVSGSVELAQRQFSQQQERDADRFALELLNASEHKVGGALTFFKRIKALEASSSDFMSTHPPTQERITALEQLIAEKNFQL